MDARGGKNHHSTRSSYPWGEPAIADFNRLRALGSQGRHIRKAARCTSTPQRVRTSSSRTKTDTNATSWAAQQTGFDPSEAYPSNPNYYGPQPCNPSQPHVLGGAGRGAAMGAVGGAIGGNAGKGAAAGAAVGAMPGGFRRRNERKQLTASCCQFFMNAFARPTAPHPSTPTGVVSSSGTRAGGHPDETSRSRRRQVQLPQTRRLHRFDRRGLA
jgi:hypothetical protein